MKTVTHDEMSDVKYIQGIYVSRSGTVVQFRVFYRRGLVVFFSFCLALGLTTLFIANSVTPSYASSHVSPTSLPHYVSASHWPILFIHGFNRDASIPTGCNGLWGDTENYLVNNGFQRDQLKTIGFYNGDSGCDLNLKNIQDPHCASYLAGNVGTTNEDLRHIACNLSWYIWNNYTQYGNNVQVVAHSMGGMIIRSAMYETPISAAFPPHLLVQDIVTLSAPHGGVPPIGSAGIACGGCWQVSQLAGDGSFLSDLRNYGTNPQGANGTDWTIMGSSCESWFNGGVDASSSMSMAATHKVLYLSPPCYHHGDYMHDQSNSYDLSAYFCNNACVGKPSSSTGASNTYLHSLHDMLYALTSSAW